MESENEQLYDKAMEAITNLFSDSSVSQAEAIRQLESLIDEIKMLIDTLDPNN